MIKGTGLIFECERKDNLVFECERKENRGKLWNSIKKVNLKN